jgi:hypothetical protein
MQKDSGAKREDPNLEKPFSIFIAAEQIFFFKRMFSKVV